MQRTTTTTIYSCMKCNKPEPQAKWFRSAFWLFPMVWCTTSKGARANESCHMQTKLDGHFPTPLHPCNISSSSHMGCRSKLKKNGSVVQFGYSQSYAQALAHILPFPNGVVFQI